MHTVDQKYWVCIKSQEKKKNNFKKLQKLREIPTQKVLENKVCVSFQILFAYTDMHFICMIMEKVDSSMRLCPVSQLG